MARWEAGFEAECHRLVETICDDATPAAARATAWRAFLEQVGPRIEGWAEASPLLRRVGLTGEDEPRAVLVDVLERLSDRGFANLKAYLARRPADETELAESDLVDQLVRLAVPEAVETQAGAGAKDDVERTPLRGWLVNLTRFTVKEHVKQRLGWRGGLAHHRAPVEPERAGATADALRDALAAHTGVVEVGFDEAASIVEITYRAGPVRVGDLERVIASAGWRVRGALPAPTKRDVGSGAQRLDDVPEGASRPPITDLIAVRRALAEIRAQMAAFPTPMRRALELWLTDAGWSEIAATVPFADEATARAQVRAGLARLRDRFRGAWPELFGGHAPP